MNAAAGNPILEVENLSIHIRHAYGNTPVVSGVSFSVLEGENLGIVGESGCGKTLTGLSVIGLLPRLVEATGSIRWKGQDVLRLSPTERRSLMGREIGMVYQDPLMSLNPGMTVKAQLQQALRIDGDHRRDRLYELLELVHLPNPKAMAAAYPFQLSGGQRQRVLIALALARRPSILIGDEPTTALDETVQAQIVELLRSLQAELSFTTILITHNLALVKELCERTMVMYAGQLVEAAHTEELVRDPRHPYAAGLLGSIVSLEAKERPARSIEGVVPSPLEFSPGCRFVERCANAGDPCAGTPPLLESVGDRHDLACYFPVGGHAGAAG
ncbi:ABC transporter ATP-binding protein [Candidatus Spongiisocius sp.]|uniref:ABC transporter ATP-binding protein n=1 Tax=Candidatus Spongiisocius sp. TaxID=3101273 RepID=UPI003B5A8FD8